LFTFAAELEFGHGMAGAQGSANTVEETGLGCTHRARLADGK
jgi:hypothetical protein